MEVRGVVHAPTAAIDILIGIKDTVYVERQQLDFFRTTTLPYA